MMHLLYGELALFIRLPGREQMEHYAGEFVGSGCDCLGRTELGSHAAEELPQVRLIAVKRFGQPYEERWKLGF
jgi:hypothetical protein